MKAIARIKTETPKVRSSEGQAVTSTVWTYNESGIVYNQSDYTYNGLLSVFNYPPLARVRVENKTPFARIA